MSELSKFQAVIQSKCPRCRKGNIFTGATYGFKLQKMNDHCSHCNLKYEREPGYFYVAMFVSYAMTCAEIIALAVGAHILGLALTFENLWNFVAVIFGGLLLLSPINFRYSRVILLHWLTPGLGYMPEKYKV